jgi:hypothetical protein
MAKVRRFDMQSNPNTGNIYNPFQLYKPNELQNVVRYSGALKNILSVKQLTLSEFIAWKNPPQKKH